MFKGKITFGKISQNIGQNTTNIEATEGFGTFGKASTSSSKPVDIVECEDDIEQKQLKEVMGIAGFGKKAKTFNVEVNYNSVLIFLSKYLFSKYF